MFVPEVETDQGLFFERQRLPEISPIDFVLLNLQFYGKIPCCVRFFIFNTIFIKVCSERKRKGKSTGLVIPTQSPPRPVHKGTWPPRLVGRCQLTIVGGLLLLYIFMAVSASTQKSTTFDESRHLTLGYLYWTQPGSHLASESGMFAQAWAALPLLVDHLQAPQEKGEPWGNLGVWGETYRFFYSMGNDPSAMLFQARTMISLLGAALGALIFFWSRDLFGVWGGFVALLLFIFCPNMLAHGTLATADMAAAFGFFAATFSFWKLSHTVSWGNLLFSVLALCCLALAKMSAVLILPIFILMLAVRFFSRRPIEFQLFTNKILAHRLARAGIWSLLLALHLIAVVGILWLSYNFRYDSWNQETARRQILSSPDFSFWSGAGMKASILQNIDQAGLLPPAYLEGLSFTLESSDFRNAFLCGRCSVKGWWWFFPFAFLIKTPIGSLLLFLFSFVALVLWRWVPRHWMGSKSADSCCPKLYDLSPLLILGGTYGFACLTSHLNIGLRHMLPIYPVFFVLAGANVFWLLAEVSIFRIALIAFLVGTMTESLSVWPNYLAFFNQFVGRARNGYQYLVDSSLDWGQDLPGLHQWLEKNVPSPPSTPVYLSYFGTGDPKFYGINALLLPGFFDMDSPQTFPLQHGVYCISATMLQGVYSRFPLPWTPANETLRSQLRDEIDRWNSTANDPQARNHLLQENGASYWATCTKIYGELRLARLCAYLRHRPPDDEVGYSILIYRLSDEEVQQALRGASPEG
jgi:hypothetical protein